MDLQEWKLLDIENLKKLAKGRAGRRKELDIDMPFRYFD